MIEYILSFFLVLIVSALASHPFLRPRVEDDLLAENDAESETLALLYEKRDIYRLSLRDIEFDRDTEKLDQRDYAGLKEKYRQKALETAQRISELETRAASGSPERKSQTHSVFQAPGK